MQLKIPNTILDLTENEKTYFDTDKASGQTSLSANGVNFATDDYIVLGKLGTEKSEIVKIATASSTTITLSSSTVFAHNRGDLMTFVPYNQIVVERSTDGGTTYSPLTAVDIQADNLDTIIQRPTDGLTDVYKVRFYNATDGSYSQYSDEIVGSGYADNTVFAIKARALDQLGEKVGDLISDKFLNESLWEARRNVDNAEVRWAWRYKPDQNVGTIIPGRYTITAPTDLRDPNTNNNILSLRVGRQSIPLEYQTKTRFNQNYVNVAHTTLDGTVLAADATITLTDSGDFDESGTITIAAETEALTRDAVTYTANNEVTNVLSGVTGDEAHATGRDVWQGATFGLPRAYTIENGVIKFDLPFDNAYAGESIDMDYYGDLVAYDSDADVLDEPEFDLYVSYLKWKIKYKKSNGTLVAKDDSDYQEWQQGKRSLIDANFVPQTITLIPG